MTRQEAGIDPVALGRYDKLLSSFEEIERKGSKTPHTSLNGHMTSFLTQEGRLALRLPEKAREAMLSRKGADPCIQHGRLMKDFVLVPDSLLARTKELEKHFRASLDHVASMKPKATSRSKATKKTVQSKPASKKTTRRRTGVKEASPRKTTAKNAKRRR